MADIVNRVDDKVFIVNASEDFSGDFIGFEEMVEVGACVIFTTFAVAVGHERSKIVGVFGVFDVDATVFSIKRAVSCHAGGANTVKSVATKFGADKEVYGFLPHAEEVARLVLWEDVVDCL